MNNAVKDRAWIWYLSGCAAVASAYFVIPHTPTTKLVLYNGIGLSAVIATLWAVGKSEPGPQRKVWMLFAAGQASFLTADVLFYIQEKRYGETPFPSISDVFYLAMYPLVIIGLIGKLRNVLPGRDRTSLIDAAIVATAMFAVLWVLVMDAYFINSGMSLMARAISMAYPVMDVALLAVAVRLAVTVHLRQARFALLSASIASLVVADVAYGIQNVSGSFKTGSFIDAFWLGFYVLFGCAALNHRRNGAPEVVPVIPGRLSGRRFVLMFGTLLTLPLIDLWWGQEEDRIITTVASTLLSLLILLRAFGLMKIVQVGQDELRYKAAHDALTGLVNRRQFSDQLEHSLDRNERVGILFIDVDDFKTVNDSLGHQAGDQLLVEIGDRLRGCVRAGNVVARFGGDEFAVLLRDLVDEHDAVSTAKRILTVLEEPIMVNERVVHAAASIGIAISDAEHRDVDSLLRNADVAMYLSKSKGKGRFEFFERSMFNRVREQIDLKTDLKGAIERNEFILHYQPIIDLATGGLTGVEALLRWNHPTRGLVPPNDFIPMAEQSGLIVPIGEWVLNRACLDTRRWQTAGDGHTSLSVSVNLSVVQLHDSGLLQTVTDALRTSGLAPHCLTLEITESMLATDTDRGTQALERLKALGVKVAIDDFGTGYSSLHYLRNFRVDSIKIDRSFVSEIHRSATASALVRAVVDLSRALGAVSVAEGIEQEDQARALEDLGCAYAQGYLYSKPIAPDAMARLLRKSASRRHRSPRAHQVRQDIRGFETEIVRGSIALENAGDEFDELNRDLEIPVTARRPWLALWSRIHHDWDPLGVYVRRTGEHSLAAAALLGVRPGLAGTEVVALGHGSSMLTCLPARDHDSAAALADGIARALDGLSKPWALDIEQLVDYDPVAMALARRLEKAQVLPDLRVPRVQLIGDRPLEEYLSRGMRKQLRRAADRIVADGHTSSISFSSPGALDERALQAIEAIHVARDHGALRRSDLDEPAEREFWRAVTRTEIGAWEVEIATMRIDDEIAAYVIALLDGPVYRVFDGRMNSEFARYSPGRLVEAAALERAIAQPRFRELDWMSGIAAEKLLAANDVQTRTRLVARSGAVVSSRPVTELSPRDELVLVGAAS